MPLDRHEKILSKINRAGKGLEIGPSYSPVAPRSAGFDVEILDHLSQAELVEKYSKANVNLSAIERVDYVWKGESYQELTGKSGYYDWIIASHVIEHTPDLVGFLKDCSGLLKESGVLSLVVPDKRYCFDHFRPVTGLARIVDAHLWNKSAIHSPGTIAEALINSVKKNGAIAWHAGTPGEYQMVYTPSDARFHMERVLKEHAHLDEHAWCFTPSSFRLIMMDLASICLLELKETGFHPTEGIEFFVSLSKRGAGPGCSREDMMRASLAEASAL
jgi:hypothetical protein